MAPPLRRAQLARFRLITARRLSTLAIPGKRAALAAIAAVSPDEISFRRIDYNQARPASATA
jgi:hypothetical protein